MFRAVWFLVLLSFVSLGAALVAESPGKVSLKWLGYQIEASVGILLTVVIISSLVLATILRVLSFMRRVPRRARHARQEWRRRRGYKALTQGMLAVAAGDATEAKRLSKKAENLLAEPPLTMLLSAQAAQLAGDGKAAGKFFEAMAEQPKTKYLGLSGQLKQAIQDGDQNSALELAEKASNLKPKTGTVTATLFDLQIKNGDWEKAEETVKKSIRQKTITSDTGRRHRAILLYQRSLEDEVDGRLGDALQHAQRANNLAPEFVPAAVRTALLLQGAGKRRKAVSIVEEAWVSNPHPHLSEVMKGLAPGAGPLEKMRILENLAGYNKDHMESHLAIAESALAAGMWQETREHLEAAAGTNPSAKICRYMAELVEAEKGDVDASREWLRQASLADPDSAWVCKSCGNAITDWELVCGRCDTFDSLVWQTPPRVTRMESNKHSDGIQESSQSASNSVNSENCSDTGPDLNINADDK